MTADNPSLGTISNARQAWMYVSESISSLWWGWYTILSYPGLAETLGKYQGGWYLQVYSGGDGIYRFVHHITCRNTFADNERHTRTFTSNTARRQGQSINDERSTTLYTQITKTGGRHVITIHRPKRPRRWSRRRSVFVSISLSKKRYCAGTRQ